MNVSTCPPLSKILAQSFITVVNWVALKHFFSSLQRNWESRADGFFYFKQEEKDSDDVIPAKQLAEQTIEYARELEMIV